LTFDEHGERKLNFVDLPAAAYPAGGSSRVRVAVSAISVEEKRVSLAVEGAGEHEAHARPDELIVEVSTKPLMMVLWTGVVLIVAGTVVAFKRRLSPE
jgi:hypothetical protein